MLAPTPYAQELLAVAKQIRRRMLGRLPPIHDPYALAPHRDHIME
jgi:hypothetical protein